MVAYRTDIVWDPEWPSLLFEERDRPDASFAHRGRLYLPASSPFLHLVSLTKGAMRMVLVSQIDQAGSMRGLMTTLNKQRATYQPVACPVVYARRENFADCRLGEIAPGEAAYAGYEALLRETLERLRAPRAASARLTPLTNTRPRVLRPGRPRRSRR
jgi:hypothetical protein